MDAAGREGAFRFHGENGFAGTCFRLPKTGIDALLAVRNPEYDGAKRTLLRQP
jgi:hypothetical protein